MNEAINKKDKIKERVREICNEHGIPITSLTDLALLYLTAQTDYIKELSEKMKTEIK